MNIMAGSLGGLFPQLSTDRLEVLSLVINNVCNLRCRHCYLEPLPGEPHLTRNEWLAFFRSLFGDLVPSVVSFAGKEVFINSESAELLFEAIRTRDRIQDDFSRRTHIGVITNGTLLHRFQDELSRVAPDHFDVSIDGLPAVHDDVRGQGAFDRLAPNLRWLVQAFPNRVWVTHTLFSHNVSRVPDFVEFYEQSFGVRRFSFGFYQALPYTSTELALDEMQRTSFLDTTLMRLGSIVTSGPIEVIVELGQESIELITRLRAVGWVTSDAPISSNLHRLENGVTARINVCTIPVGLWRAVRVTPEGYWLAAEDLVYAKEYTRRAVTRLRDHRFDSRRAYQAGLMHPRFAELARGTSGKLSTRPPEAYPTQSEWEAAQRLAPASRA